MSTFALDGVVAWPPELATRWRERGYWRGETHFGFLAERAAAHSDRVALIDHASVGGRSVTYAELIARAERIAAGMVARGVRPGDRVVVQLPNRASFVEVVVALFRVGALPVFALPAHRGVEIGYFLRHTDAVGYVVADTHDGFDYRALTWARDNAAEGTVARTGT